MYRRQAMNNTMMDGFPREKINMVMNLKELCVSQMQAIFGPGCQLQASRGKFDVLQCKLGDTFVAHAIVYPQGSNGNSRHYPSWQCLLTGKSTEGVVNALENLWIQLQGEIGGPIKNIEAGRFFQGMTMNGRYIIH